MERKARPRNQSHVKRSQQNRAADGAAPHGPRGLGPGRSLARSPPGPGCGLGAGDDRHRTARRAAPREASRCLRPRSPKRRTEAELAGAMLAGVRARTPSRSAAGPATRPGTYLPLVRRADVEAVDDSGHAGLQGELGVGRPEVRRPGGEGDSCQRPASPRRAHGSRTGRSAGHGRCGRSTPDSPERGPPRPGLPRGHRALALACSGEAA